MEEPKQVTRFNQRVWETPAMDILRREHCMCLHCKHLTRISGKNCDIAEYIYTMCEQHGNAFIMTRCDTWEGIE
jgi:hypothetical protein